MYNSIMEQTTPAEFDKYSTKDQLMDLSKSYLELRKTSIETVYGTKSKTEYDNLEENYKKNLNYLLDSKNNDLFSTEDGCIAAKFVLEFSRGILPPEKREEIGRNLEQNKEKYPVLSDIDQKINIVGQKFIGFFIGKEKKLNLFIPSCTNALANVLIGTEIGRLITNQNTNPGNKSPNRTSSAICNQSDSGFKINFRK